MTDKFSTIQVERKETLGQITLHRPEVNNAFDDVMVSELQQAFNALMSDAHVRVVVLTGSGRSFCSGVDLAWMKSAQQQGAKQNEQDCQNIADLFLQIYTAAKPVIARVNGAAIGGGVGLVAACDIAVATEGALFSLSAASIGVVPTCIGPYVLKRMGERAAREYFLTGQRFRGHKALQLGLVNHVVGSDMLDAKVEDIAGRLLKGGPSALALTKQMLSEYTSMPLVEAGPRSAQLLANLRTSDEAQQGMACFLNKSTPKWWPRQS